MTETASWGHRALALFVDWVAATFAVMAFIGVGGWLDEQLAGVWTLAVFLVEKALLTATMGASFGQLLTRLRVVRTDSEGPPDLGHALLRSVLVCLVIPPLVSGPDGRGLHDLAAGTVVRRLVPRRPDA